MTHDPAWHAKLYAARRTKNGHIRSFTKRLFEMEGVGAVLLDEDFRIVEMSAAIAELFGCRREDALGRAADEWMEGLGLPSKPFDRTLLEGKAFRNRIWSYASGRARYELMLDGEIVRRRGGPATAFVLFRDVSHLLTLEEQIRQSDRLKTIGQIAAGTAHEIRNPLTAIKGFMQLLSKSLSEREMDREKEYVGIVLSELERVNDLVSEFLLLSKPKEARYAPVRIGRIMQEILPMIRNEALLHGVSVRYYPKPELLPILADKELLKQVFLNLGKNAIEAMGEGGTLIIRERACPDMPGKLLVEIADTGHGIPKEMLGRIFEPFFTTKPQGTGLGLAVCQRIVHDLGGSLEAESDGNGTTFSVGLPYAQAGAELEIAAGGGAHPADDV